jgi:hypothetical protein
MRAFWRARLKWRDNIKIYINPINAELNPICYLLALVGGHHILHVSRVRVKEIRREGADKIQLA